MYLKLYCIKWNSEDSWALICSSMFFQRYCVSYVDLYRCSSNDTVLYYVTHIHIQQFIKMNHVSTEIELPSGFCWDLQVLPMVLGPKRQQQLCKKAPVKRLRDTLKWNIDDVGKGDINNNKRSQFLHQSLSPTHFYKNLCHVNVLKYKPFCAVHVLKTIYNCNQ